MIPPSNDDTDPACPRALLDTVPAPPPVASWWARSRKWFIDGSIVATCGFAAYRGWVEWDTVVPAVVAVVLAHAPPQATSFETAATPLISALGKLFRRRG